ncbi:MAG TPA: GYF domain-containing protein, partial [Anaeromyxobacteraceae bacterium]|nr:GYF domain-containing protein [Anaeromyxobacteraceae bacterium]
MAPPALQHEIDDPALDGGDWLFKKDGQVYGPVEGRRLAELLYAGQLSGVTLVSPGDGSWGPLVQVPAFLVHVKKAEAARRVEQEVTGRRVLQARKARTRTAALVAAAALVVAAAVGVALLIGRSRLERDPLLEGFGAGISIVAPARIGVAAPAGADEI